MDIYTKPTVLFTYDIAFLQASVSGFASGGNGCGCDGDSDDGPWCYKG